MIHALTAVIEAAGGKTPIRTGRLGTRQARGVFKVEPEVIRLLEANNIPTAWHEAAHAIEKHIYGNPKGSPWVNPRVGRSIQKELVALGRALYGDRKPAGGYKREGWAEFLRLWGTEAQNVLLDLGLDAPLALAAQGLDDRPRVLLVPHTRPESPRVCEYFV